MADLREDAIREIARRLPCVADRDDAAHLCTKWWAALSRPLSPPSPPPPLPWLLIPSAESIRVCCQICGIDDCTIRHKLTVAHGARYFGSYDGGWLFLAFGQTRCHALINIRALDPMRTARPLPDVMPSRGGHGQRREEMVILAAALSSPPDNQDCVAAGIIMPLKLFPGQRQVAFWRMGDVVTLDVADGPCQPSLEAVDVVYQNGSFYFLTEGEHVLVCTPAFYQDGGLEGVSKDAWLFQRREGDSHCVLARYLVQARGALLMVLRIGNRAFRLPTFKFKVFEMKEKHMARDGVDKIEYTWSEMPKLDGRILFVGRGCSRSYDMDDYVGLQLGEGVHFLDDLVFFDEAMMFRGAEDRSYPCIDNGTWSEAGTPNVQRSFPEQGPSKHSSPVWLLP